MRKKVAKAKVSAGRKAPVKMKESSSSSMSKELRELRQQVAKLQKQIAALKAAPLELPYRDSDSLYRSDLDSRKRL